MRRFIVLAAALALGLASAMAYSDPTSALPGASVLKACAAGQGKIEASRLPDVVEPGRCPVGDRIIADNGVEGVLPARGSSVYAEALDVSGAQELVITHRTDGTIELGKVGNDSAAAETTTRTASSAPAECSDGAYSRLSYRVQPGLRYFFNRATTPSELTPSAAEGAIVRATANVANTRNACGLGDRVPVGMAYAGATRAAAGVTTSGGCGRNDGTSVVSFGALPSGILAVTCTYYNVVNGPDPVTASDVKVNAGPTWTTNPAATSCRNRYDLESIMTHERGHTFGLSHVAESTHRNLTMSTTINGPCQASERTLGRGDVLGLDGKY